MLSPKKLGISFLCLLVLGVPGLVLAHATPFLYEPENSSVIEEAREEVRIHFSERVEEQASGISIFAPDGSRVGLGEARVDPSNRRLYRALMEDAGEGTYTVSWQVVSADDGHFTKGAFSFSVGEASEAPLLGQIQVQHVTRLPQALATGMELLGQAFLLGAAFFLAFLWAPLKRRFLSLQSLEAKLRGRLAFFAVCGVVLGVAGSVGYVILKTLDLQQLRPGSFGETFLIFAQTNDGSFALARAFLSLLMGSLLLVKLRSLFQALKPGKIAYTLLSLAGLIILLRAIVSHASASSFLPAVSVFVNALQLASKEWWVGLAVLLACIILPLVGKAGNAKIIFSLLADFSRFAVPALAALALSGLYILWLHGKDFSYLIGEEWTSRALLVIFLVALAGSLRLFHQVFAERIRSPFLARVVGLTLPAEAIAGVVLMFVTAVSLLTTPFYPGQAYSFSRSAESGEAVVELSVHPNRPDSFLIEITDQRGEQLAFENAVITLENRTERIGPLVVEAEQVAQGRFVLPRSELSLPGEWVVGVAAQRPGSYDAVASFVFQYPEEIASTLLDEGARHFSLFEALLLLAAFLSVLASYALYLLNRKARKEIAGMLQIESSPVRPHARRLGVAASALIVLLSAYGFNEVAGKTAFQRLCEKNGDFWIQSVPMRDYKPLSSGNVTGCTLQIGLFHFADRSEYEYFRQPVQTFARLETLPAVLRAGEQADLALQVYEIKDGQTLEEAPRLSLYHDRILHAIVIGEDLETFAHIHAEDVGPVTEEQKEEGRYLLEHTFPKAGNYVLAIDYTVRGVEMQQLFPLLVEGGLAMEEPGEPNFSRVKNFEGYDVSFRGPETFATGTEQRFSYFITKDGSPVRDLEPYLGAAMHVFAVREDLFQGTHTHGETYPLGSIYVQKYLQLAGFGRYHTHFVPEEFGPVVETGVSLPLIFPTPGAYVVFGEFSHEGKIVLTDFTVQVR